jgi:formylglycine-generating enzyme required for sulfatase activity
MKTDIALWLLFSGMGLSGCGTEQDPLVEPEPPRNVDSTSEMVLVPAGPFWMGCNVAVEESGSCGGWPDDLPYHQVTLSAFEIDRTEVSQAAYAECVDAGACVAPSVDWLVEAAPETMAVDGTTWAMAVAYCAWSEKRLPSEAEWEKAARGVNGQRYPWGNSLPTCDNATAPDSGCGTSRPPIGNKPQGASPYGGLDMAGGVMEWVHDWYGADYYAVSPAADPQGPTEGTMRVVRGGHWASELVERQFRTSFRGRASPDLVNGRLGFRCAR